MTTPRQTELRILFANTKQSIRILSNRFTKQKISFLKEFLLAKPLSFLAFKANTWRCARATITGQTRSNCKNRSIFSTLIPIIPFVFILLAYIGNFLIANMAMIYIQRRENAFIKQRLLSMTS